MTETLTKFRHLGLYRSVPDGQGAMRLVTWDEAVLDGRVLKRLSRHGAATRGMLHSYLGSANQTIEEVTASLVRLQEWGMVELAPGTRVDSVRVSITGNGDFWAQELLAKDDLDQAIAVEEHKRAVGRAE